eukprot:Nk52_evm17s370 gene=Nk52_evmTU17s370
MLPANAEKDTRGVDGPSMLSYSPVPAKMALAAGVCSIVGVIAAAAQKKPHFKYALNGAFAGAFPVGLYSGTRVFINNNFAVPTDGNAEPAIDGYVEMKVSIMAGMSTGLVCTGILVGTPRASVAGALVGGMFACLQHKSFDAFQSWRLRKSLETHYPELLPGYLQMKRKEEERGPWYNNVESSVENWPDWVPLRRTKKNDEHDMLKQELLYVEKKLLQELVLFKKIRSARNYALEMAKDKPTVAERSCASSEAEAARPILSPAST